MMKSYHAILIGGVVSLSAAAAGGALYNHSTHDPVYVQRKAEVSSLDTTIQHLQGRKKNLASQLEDCYLKSNSHDDCNALSSQSDFLDKKISYFEKRRMAVARNYSAAHGYAVGTFVFGWLGFLSLSLGILERKEEKNLESWGEAHKRVEEERKKAKEEKKASGEQ